MKILNNIIDLKKAIKRIPDLGFVPTMGGLHRGHISLITTSKKKCKKTLISIYINPKQFNKIKDFNSYPRNLLQDIKLLKKLKVDFVFIPQTSDIYRIKEKKIILDNVDKILCAKFRKGHFEGVLDIMNRFIKIITPKYVFLGKKDYQQFFLIKKYFNNTYKKTIIYPCKTIRDKNFIALSTRNLLLNKKDLNKASLIANFLFKFKEDFKKKNKKSSNTKEIKKYLMNKFKVKFDYLEIRNDKDLSFDFKKNNLRLFVAYYINKIRLIDNF